MNLSKIAFNKINNLAFKDVYYQEHVQKLKDFITFEPTLEGLKEAADQRSSFPVNRTLLNSVLEDQYADIQKSTLQSTNIEKLKQENTFTIVTAHQPSLLGGPGYYFYKIYSAINLAESLNRKYPEYHFVPVFINGAEDHDFDEIKSIHLFGKTITWESDQSGPVGRFNTNGLETAIEQAADILGDSPKALMISNIFKNALNKSKDYNDFVRHWINDFFSDSGLIVFNMDDKRLKSSFVPIMKRELIEKTSQSLVIKTQNSLNVKHNFKPQAYVRDINLFYLRDQSRERIYMEDGLYKINNSDLLFTEKEILDHLEAYPERFSPNVVIRPVYEEFILPNLAYIGGGGELAYWLERKSQFEAFNVFFPVLIRRNSVLIIPKHLQKMIDKLSLAEDDIWKDEEQLINIYLENNIEEDFNLKSESKKIMDAFFGIAEKAKAIDPTLESTVLGEAHKTVKAVENIENRLKRSIKQKVEVQINQIRNLKSKLFPNNNLQERVESFLPFWISDEYDMDAIMKEHLNPLNKSFLVFYL